MNVSLFLKQSPQAAFVFGPALYLYFSSLYLLWLVLSNYISRDSKWLILGVTLLPPYLPTLYFCICPSFVFLQLVFVVACYQTNFPGTHFGVTLLWQYLPKLCEVDPILIKTSGS